MQSVAAESTFSGNVMFNMPRAGVNINDGFGGGTATEWNLIFNCVRETSDHGPFNSWDRQPYLTTIKDGVTPSLFPKQNTITRNFFINNYHSVWPIGKPADDDDR
jgi:hypothetical protein